MTGQQPIEVTDTLQLEPVGRVVTGSDPLYGDGEFIYLPGVASTVAGDLVVYNEYSAGSTVRAVAGSKGRLAVAMSANITGQWGWYQTGGAAVVNVAAAFAAGADIYLTATAGTVDDAVVAGDLITGAVGLTAIGTPSAGKAVVGINAAYVA
jgi:hypothetical protein